MKTQIINGNVLLPEGLKKVNLELEKNIITKISNKLKINSSAKTIDAEGKYILPGFIDIHTNGIASFDLTNGLYNSDDKKFSISEEKYISGLDNALHEFLKHGTTLIGFTTLEASKSKLSKIFNLIAKYKNEHPSIFKKVFHGIYMEGTFMKDEKFRGAHNPKYFFEPSIELFKEFQKAADGNIKIVNVVPEWGEPALKLIKFLVSKKIVCAAGHTNANGDEYNRAVKSGIQLAVHAFNGPSSSSFKPFNNGGAVEAFLTSDKMFVEIIPDGYHVNKAYVLDLIRRKGVDKCIAITDSMFMTKAENIDHFEVNGVNGKVSKNRKYAFIEDQEDENSLFGSVLTMDEAFENLLNWFTHSIAGIWNEMHEAVDFENALINTSKMCSVNPAKVLGIYSNKNSNVKNNLLSTGSIEKNKSADFLIADIRKIKNNYKLKINKTIVKGSILDLA